MANERLEVALAWCKKNKLRLDRLDLFNREDKKRSKKPRNKYKDKRF